MSALQAIAPEPAMARAIRLGKVRDKARFDPKPLLAEMRGFDPTLQEFFEFDMYNPDGPWGWQSLLVDWWMGNVKPGSEQEQALREVLGWWEEVDPRSRKFLILKARQLGITWLAVAVAVWYLLYRPGSNNVCYSHGEDEAKLLIQRAWLMLQSLPIELRDHIEILYPDNAELPSQRIVVRHPDGRLSTLKALPDTQKAGHGETITFCIMDEVARMNYARGIYTAVNPAVSRGGTLVMVSTANGVSNLETGEGNFFHNLWATRGAKGLQAAFLKWNLHPERDDAWYQSEAMALPPMERNQQYPENPDNAFILSGDLYFDPEALGYYATNVRHAKHRGQFLIVPGGASNFVEVGNGVISVFEQPRAAAKYGLSADSATGRSQDYSVGHVIDLTSGDLVAKIRGKMDMVVFSAQLKCLGRWYNNAKLIPERTGVGEALIVALRSDADGLKPYTNIYMHTRRGHIERPTSDDYGFPMQKGTRMMLLERMRSWVQKRRIPFLDPTDVDECRTFIYRETSPSPRAMDGCNDDSVMSIGLALHLMEEVGELPTNVLRERRWKKGSYKSPVPWKLSVNRTPHDLPPLEVARNEDGSRRDT